MTHDEKLQAIRSIITETSYLQVAEILQACIMEDTKNPIDALDETATAAALRIVNDCVEKLRHLSDANFGESASVAEQFVKSVADLRAAIAGLPDTYKLYADDTYSVLPIVAIQVQIDEAMDPHEAVVFYFGDEALSTEQMAAQK